MEALNRTTLNRFMTRVKSARKAYLCPELHHHDLEQYCQTLINGASLFQLIESMQCSDRMDLVDSCDDGSSPTCDMLADKFKAFTKQYLGLELLTHGDPRGSVFKLKVPNGIGDSFGSGEELCVPCVDAYQCF